MHEEINGQLKQIELNYNGKVFRDIVSRVKKDRINDNELLDHIEKISLDRFREKGSFTVNVHAGNLLELAIAIAAVVLTFQLSSDWMLYITALVLMTTLHPLSHFVTGSLLGIRFTHYYLDGPARIEPTLRIDHSTYLKASGKRRALMHISGVVGTIAAPLIAGLIALDKGALAVALNLAILFLLLIVFELLTSTKIGDLMKAKREYYG